MVRRFLTFLIVNVLSFHASELRECCNSGRMGPSWFKRYQTNTRCEFIHSYLRSRYQNPKWRTAEWHKELWWSGIEYPSQNAWVVAHTPTKIFGEALKVLEVLGRSVPCNKKDWFQKSVTKGGLHCEHLLTDLQAHRMWWVDALNQSQLKVMTLIGTSAILDISHKEDTCLSTTYLRMAQKLGLPTLSYIHVSMFSSFWLVKIERFTRKFYWDAMGAVQPDDQEQDVGWNWMELLGEDSWNLHPQTLTNKNRKTTSWGCLSY